MVSNNSEPKFFNGIDTWRGLAALMVCFFHFALHENNSGRLFPERHLIPAIGQYGYLGVYIFFVISGFVIPFSMAKGKYIYSKFGKFIAKRSLRIEPPYLATILLIILQTYYFSRLWGLPFVFEPERFLSHIVYVVPFIKDMEWYNVIFWTLAIEFQFYLCCAILFPLWIHRNRIVRHLSLLLFIFSAWYFADNRFATFYASIFGLGITLSLFRTGYLNKFELWLYIVVCSLLLYNGNTQPIFFAAMAAFGLLLLPDFKFSLGTYLGKISYSLYLTHGAVGGIFLMLNYTGTNAVPLFICAIGLSILFAGIFYLAIEKPVQRLSRKIKL